jgi:hypothetical protein
VPRGKVRQSRLADARQHGQLHARALGHRGDHLVGVGGVAHGGRGERQERRHRDAAQALLDLGHRVADPVDADLVDAAGVVRRPVQPEADLVRDE